MHVGSRIYTVIGAYYYFQSYILISKYHFIEINAVKTSKNILKTMTFSQILLCELTIGSNSESEAKANAF